MEKNGAILNITREELALSLSKYIEENNINIPAVLMLYPPYDDEDEISKEAIFAVNQMRNTGLMKSKIDNKFKPKEKMTINELIDVIRKLIKIVSKSAF